MKTRNALFTATTLAALSLFALTGCSAASSPSASPSASNSASSEKPSATPSPDAALTKNLVGPGCAAYAKAVPDGAGSIVGMAQDPVAVAASNNPLLKTLVAAVSGKLNPNVNLVDTLNGSEFTVFAPVDDAFAKIDPATIDTLKTNSDLLTKILTYHVVPGQILPDQIAGTHKTVEGQDLTVTGSGNDLKVGDASVICGGVKTANATVYLVDSVLLPPQ
ncbi:fasciclin domain-containing protein [Mycetocola sp. JXN-3]|uniref:fasciclin domain-containing protein n=1 Tax=Mycetocola sp. JXN-3 TaxID=2116510 RepID=UPI00165D1CDC|nr:fasciclin domain-containing protein [Mycetocola sp. JXN-3]